MKIAKNSEEIREIGDRKLSAIAGQHVAVEGVSAPDQRGPPDLDLLIERHGFLGGAAVSGMSGTICGLYTTVREPRASQRQQLIFGFAERFRGLL
jgi:hypothetical protein